MLILIVNIIKLILFKELSLKYQEFVKINFHLIIIIIKIKK